MELLFELLPWLSKTKRVFWGFFSLDYKAMGEYLEEMAENGWMLK